MLYREFCGKMDEQDWTSPQGIDLLLPSEIGDEDCKVTITMQVVMEP